MDLNETNIKSVGLRTHIWNNNILSVVMLFSLPLSLMLIVWAIFGSYSSMMDKMPAIWIMIALWYAYAWFFNIDLIQGVTGARRILRRKNPRVYNLLENLAMIRGMPMPALFIINTEARNAFASGINEKSYCVIVTSGLVNSLNDDELSAVMAHELSHIENHDVRLMMVTTTFAGIFNTLYLKFKSMGTAGMNMASKRGDNAIGLPFLFLPAAIISFVLAGLCKVASIVPNLSGLYISRKREYVADASAAMITRKPEAMISALLKIEGRSEMPQQLGVVSEMCISPVSKSQMWETHPSIASRIEALKTFGGYGLSSEDYAIQPLQSEASSGSDKPAAGWGQSLEDGIETGSILAGSWNSSARRRDNEWNNSGRRKKNEWRK